MNNGWKPATDTVQEFVSKYDRLYQPIVLQKLNIEGISYWVMVDPDDEQVFNSMGWNGEAIVYCQPTAIYCLMKRTEAEES